MDQQGCAKKDVNTVETLWSTSTGNTGKPSPLLLSFKERVEV